MDPDRRERALLYASGVAAALLVLILVYAVIHTAQSSRHRPSAPVTPMPHTTSHPAPRTTTPPPVTSTTTTTTTTEATSTSATSATPTESAAQIVPPPEPSSSTTETTAPTPTTIPNPYVTTSPPNAGAY